MCILSASIAGAQDSFVSGSCSTDTALNETRCTYSVFSGYPPLSYIILPLSTTCIDQYIISSSFFTFDTAQLHIDPTNGEVFGVKSQQEPPPGQMATIQITFSGLFSTGAEFVHAAVKTDPVWRLYPVPTVIECPFQPRCEWSIDATNFDYLIREPGTYVARMGQMALKANTPVTVQFASFADNGTGGSSPTAPAITYAFTAGGETSPPAQFDSYDNQNALIISIPDNEQRVTVNIWSRISVKPSIPAGEYQNLATITLVLENGFEWAEGDDAAERKEANAQK
jgi:hypothetical protein